MKTVVNFILSVAFAGLWQQALACSCSVEPNVSERELVRRKFESHQLVAVAEVTKVMDGHILVGGRKVAGRIIQFYLGHIFRGHRREVAAFIQKTQGMCQVSVKKGEVWLLYANDELYIPLGFCGPSGILVGNLRDVGHLYEFEELAAVRKAN